MIGETDDFMEILDRFVNRPRVIGGIVHDARIAAVCVAHGVEALLTRDRDFSMFPQHPHPATRLRAPREYRAQLQIRVVRRSRGEATRVYAVAVSTSCRNGEGSVERGPYRVGRTSARVSTRTRDARVTAT